MNTLSFMSQNTRQTMEGGRGKKERDRERSEEKKKGYNFADTFKPFKSSLVGIYAENFVSSAWTDLEGRAAIDFLSRKVCDPKEGTRGSEENVSAARACSLVLHKNVL